MMAYALYSLLIAGGRPMIRQGWAYVAGLSGGITSAMFGAGGPPYAIYLSMRPHSKEQIRATLAVTSLVSIGSRIVAFGFCVSAIVMDHLGHRLGRGSSLADRFMVGGSSTFGPIA